MNSAKCHVHSLCVAKLIRFLIWMQKCKSTDGPTVKARAKLEGILSYVRQRDSWLKGEYGESYNDTIAKCALINYTPGWGIVYVGVASLFL